MPLSLYLNLSLCLAKAYMIYFEITKIVNFALITQQILKPLAYFRDLFLLGLRFSCEARTNINTALANEICLVQNMTIELLHTFIPLLLVKSAKKNGLAPYYKNLYIQ